MSIRTYDPAKNVASFLGLVITGFADGEFIKAERAEDTFTAHVGAGGEEARVMSRNRMGSVTITLMQTSLSNDILSALQVADELAGTGSGPLFIKELNGTTAVLAPNAWIKKPPAMGRGKEMGNVEWVFECSAMTVFNGGILA